jgi:Xaa-Pro dipeptidase
MDGLVCLSPENVAYTAGFVVPSQPVMRWRHAATVLRADGRYAMVCVDMEESAVREASPGTELRVWREFGGSAMQAVADLLGDFGLAGGRIGLEMGYVPASAYQQLSERLPEARLCPADELLSSCRKIKTAGEVSLLERLARMADTGISSSCREVKAGASELDIAAALTQSLYEAGAQQFKLLIVASGERSQLPNAGPTARVLEPGDVCRIEVFPVIDGYHAGVCRTAVVGEASAEARRVYQVLSECRTAVLGALRPGAGARAVYRAYRSRFDELGMPAISFVGHGTGLDLHEPPYLGDFDDSVLSPGMVLGVEPLVYKTGYGFGMQIKDTVVTEEAACRVLSDVSDAGEPLHIEV